MQALFLAALLVQTLDRPVRAVPDPGVVTTRQQITPAGVPSIFQGRVYGVQFGAHDHELWVLHASHVWQLDWRENRVLSQAPHGAAMPGLQSLARDGDTALFSARYAAGGKNEVRLMRQTNGRAPEVLVNGLGEQLSGAIAAANGKALVPLVFNNQLAVVDTNTKSLTGKVATGGVAPFGAVMNRAGTVAYVTHWGGRPPTAKDLTAITGYAATADKVVVDARGIASTGSVSRVDLATLKVTHTIPVELHPMGLAWDETQNRLYVANGNKDSLSVIDTQTNAVVKTISLQPFAQRVNGIAPTAVALAPGGKVFVACGGINAVLIVNAATSRIDGMIPTAWYPNSLSLSPSGRYLAIGSLLGAGSGWREAPSKRAVHAVRGAAHVVELPDAAQLASYTTAVAENSRMALAGSPQAAPAAPRPGMAAKAIPARSGEPSLIEHVVYIVKENRTYDQLFGDLGRGNGDPSLVMFGESVTPNQRKLAREFVLLDNFYATGGNSADGHQWLTQANEVAYCLWPGYAGRSYPFDGSDPLAYSSSGFLWDYALARGKSVRIYGEYAGIMRNPTALDRPGLLKRWKNGDDLTTQWSVRAPIEPMNKILAAQYPTYTNAIPDVVRAQIFLKDVAAWERDGKMPNLTLVQLPSDHTYGTSPGTSTPKAMVADNDLALGQIVERLTKSKFWPKMAIFVVEDDAQNGVDHVDGHRTVALAISPYTRRGSIDSTFYSHQSMLKTIELILGLPTMSLFDLIAHDMRASFADTPDLAGYTAVTPAQDLFELNPPAQALRGEQKKAALASAKFKWDVPDAAPSARLNRILWHDTRGWRTPFPGTRNAVFAPMTIENEEEDEDENDR